MSNTVSSYMAQPESNWSVAGKSALRALVPIVIALLTQYEQGNITTVSAALSMVAGSISKFIFSALTAKSVSVA